jgi:hypothetical protein
MDNPRSVTMTSDSGVAKKYSDDARQRQEALDELQRLQETPRLVTSPDEREALEREMRQRTDLLGSLSVGYHIQQALDSAPLQAEQVGLTGGNMG